ncbi:hypothetical protein IWQ60_010749 [Tieghemiomyces parasiticus]|uniref:Coiled-coil SMC6 And NSE5 INteracting (CANIN) domain-containing protein n=1 Tax=Tieghemiomyces parasiticus TaxID=78921 RepID=A0A9W8DMD2_9FUNG|nr:hypothetical protein IWQ60_010749 [Tieghemiomyces parasiticus]
MTAEGYDETTPDQPARPRRQAATRAAQVLSSYTLPTFFAEVPSDLDSSDEDLTMTVSTPTAKLLKASSYDLLSKTEAAATPTTEGNDENDREKGTHDTSAKLKQTQLSMNSLRQFGSASRPTYKFSLGSLLKQKQTSGVNYETLEAAVDAKLLDESEEADFVYNRDAVVNQLMPDASKQRLASVLRPEHSLQRTTTVTVLRATTSHTRPWEDFALNSASNVSRRATRTQDHVLHMWEGITGSPALVRSTLESHWLLHHMREGWPLPESVAQWLFQVLLYRTEPSTTAGAYATLAYHLDEALRRIVPTGMAHRRRRRGWSLDANDFYEALLHLGADPAVLQPGYRVPDGLISSPGKGGETHGADRSDRHNGRLRARGLAGTGAAPSEEVTSALTYMIRLLDRSIAARPALYTGPTLMHLVRYLTCCMLDPVLASCRLELQSLVITVFGVLPSAKVSNWTHTLVHNTLDMFQDNPDGLVRLLAGLPQTTPLCNPLVEAEGWGMPSTAHDDQSHSPVHSSSSHDTAASTPVPIVTSLSRRVPPAETEEPLTTETLPSPSLRGLQRCTRFGQLVSFWAARRLVYPNETNNPTPPTTTIVDRSYMWREVTAWLTTAPFFDVGEDSDYCALYTVVRLLDYTLRGAGNADKEEALATERIVKALRRLFGQIVDSRAAFLERSRVKDLIQRLHMRLYFTVVMPATIRPATLGASRVIDRQHRLEHFTSTKRARTS